MSDADTSDAIFVCICQHARRQPCLTSVETGKDFDGSSYYYNQTVAIIIVVIFYIIIIIITSDTDKSKL